jgi:phospholipid/cholesterol/gamma-HCH transport system substrate-binding protein
MKFSKEAKTGLLVAIAITLLILGYGWLKGSVFFNPGTVYKVAYDDANGLQKGDHVLVSGFEVGKVQSIELQEDNAGVLVTISITEKLVIAEDAKALIDGDLLGEKYIKIEPGKSNVIAKPGAMLQGNVEDDVQNKIKILSGKIDAMITSIDTTINVLSGIFTENLKEDFAKSITGIKNTLESFNKSAAKFNEILAKEEPRIEQIISNVSTTTDYVSKSEGEVKAILANLKSLSDTLSSLQWEELAEDIDLAVKNINTLSEKINKGQGSIGMLVNDKKLYDQLALSLATLDTVLTKFSNDPEIRLVLFGKKKNDIDSK